MRCDSFITRKLADHRLMMSHFPYGVIDGSYATDPRFMEYRLPDMGFPLVHGHTHGTERHYGYLFLSCNAMTYTPFSRLNDSRSVCISRLFNIV